MRRKNPFATLATLISIRGNSNRRALRTHNCQDWLREVRCRVHRLIRHAHFRYLSRRSIARWTCPATCIRFRPRSRRRGRRCKRRLLRRWKWPKAGLVEWERVMVFQARSQSPSLTLDDGQCRREGNGNSYRAHQFWPLWPLILHPPVLTNSALIDRPSERSPSISVPGSTLRM